MESLCATRGADDVVVWIFVRAAVPAGRRHARLLAQGKRYRVERYHHDRQRRHDLCAEVSMGTLARSLASSRVRTAGRSEEHTSELQSLMRISYAVFCLKKK